MKPSIPRIAVLLPFLVLGTALAAQGTTVYVNRIVTAEKGDVELGKVIRTSGPLTPQAQEALSRSVAVLGDAVQYVPASLHAPDRGGLRRGLHHRRHPHDRDPPETSAEGEAYLLDKLADFLQGQGLVDENKVDIAFTQSSLRGAPPQDGIPSCQVMKTSRGVEVSFLLTGTNGSAVSGRVTLPPASEGSDPLLGVKSSTPVRVVFRKGPITIEMPGRALS